MGKCPICAQSQMQLAYCPHQQYTGLGQQIQLGHIDSGKVTMTLSKSNLEKTAKEIRNFIEDRREVMDRKPEGVRHDEGKNRLDLVPPEAILGIGEILTFGAIQKGYGERNWEKGMDWGRCYAALQRHLNKWWAGESIDPESGKSHLKHALTNLCFLMVYEIRGIGRDDRPFPKRIEETSKTDKS